MRPHSDAASASASKKQTLQSQEQNLEDANRQLSSYCNLLKEEVHHIKEQLLRHTSCNCTLIQEYIANETKKSVWKLSASSSCSLAGSMSMGAASPGGTDSPADAEGSEQVDALALQLLCSSPHMPVVARRL
ncbi:hypothetical protein NW757_014415 [Fusarium falciforme]|nr:hypothetical protein NW757_014415 [Fusarium falciforme]